MSVGYADIKRGMVFEEVNPGSHKARRVTVNEPGMYQACVTYTTPRGCVRWMGVWNKHLSDPKRWMFVGAQNAEPKPCSDRIARRET